jgi:hypothetical protein
MISLGLLRIIQIRFDFTDSASDHHTVGIAAWF